MLNSILLPENHNRLVFFILFTLVFPFLTTEPVFSQSLPVLIVHPGNPLSEIEREELVRIFRLNKTTWKDGSRIEPVNLKTAHSVREKFFSEVLSEDSSAMESFYRKRASAASKPAPTSVLGRTVKSGGYSGLTGKNKSRGGYNQRRYQQKRVYIPKTFSTEEEVLKFVAKTRGAIGYVSKPDGSVKVVSLKKTSPLKVGDAKISPAAPQVSVLPLSQAARTREPASRLLRKGEYLVIVHPENPRTEISKEELLNIFKLRKTTWKDGEKIRSVNLKTEHPVRKKFFSKVLSEDSGAMESFYRKQVSAVSRPLPKGILGRTGKSGGYSSLTGKDKKSGAYNQRRYERKRKYTPKSFQTEKEVLEFVSENRGGIGYVSQAPGSVKVLRVLGLPVEKTREPKVAVAPPKPEPSPKPKPKRQPKPKPVPKPAPKIQVATLPASLSSRSGKTFKVHDSPSRLASDITIKGPSFPPGAKGPIRASKEIRIHIPQNLAMEWDSSVSYLKISGKAKSNLKNQVSYSRDRKTLRIFVKKDFPSEGSVVLSGMKFSNFKKASPQKAFLWLEVDNKGTKEGYDDKPIMVQARPLHLQISLPLKVKADVGARVDAISPQTEVAANPFEIEIYVLDDENRRVSVDRTLFLGDAWVSPPKPTAKKHISLAGEKVTITGGYAKLTLTYPEAGTINVLVGEKEAGGLSASFQVGFRPDYLTLTAPSCGVSGEHLAILVKAVNARGAVTENYEGSILLRSKVAGGKTARSVTRTEDRSIPLSGGKAEVQYLYPEAGSLLFSAMGTYLKDEFIETRKQKGICFRPASFRIAPGKPASRRGFYYSAPPSCKAPDYVDVTVEAVNASGEVTRNFLGDFTFKKGWAKGLVLPGAQVIGKADRGIKKIAGIIYSKKEQRATLAVTGKMQSPLCGCAPFSGVSPPLQFRQGSIVVTSKNGVAGGLTRQRTGKIVKVSRTAGSSQVSVPVTLKFKDGKTITEDNSTKVFLKIASETGAVRKSASIEGNENFTVSNGAGAFLLTDSEGETVTVSPSSNPCLLAKSGDITFSEDRLVVLTSSGRYHEVVEIKVEVQDKSGNVINKYDGTVIDGIEVKPSRKYIILPSEKTVLKGGTGVIKITNNNPKPGKMELFIIKPRIKGAALIVQSAKIRFRGGDKKKRSSFSDLIGNKIKGILGK